MTVKFNEKFHYRGDPCVKWSDIRYIKDNRCLNCRTIYRTQLRQNRKLKNKGVRYYGEPCAICKSTERYVATKSCISCIKSWREKVIKNKQKENNYNTTYIGSVCITCGESEKYTVCDRCVNCDRQIAKKKYHENKNKRVQIYGDSITYDDSPCNICNTTKRYIASGLCVVCHKEYNKQWKADNKHRRKAYKHKRRNTIVENGGNFTGTEWYDLCKQYGFTCLSCKEQFDFSELSIDHVIPLIEGGSNDIENIQPLCLTCNLRKAKQTIDYR